MIPIIRMSVLAFFLLLSGCAYSKSFWQSTQLPNTGYQPVEPIPVRICHLDPNRIRKLISPADLLRALPHESMRLAIAKVNQNLSVTYAPVAIATKGEDYIIVLDYIKFYPRSLALTYNGYTEKFLDEVNQEKENRALAIVGTTVDRPRIKVPDPRTGFRRTEEDDTFDPHSCDEGQRNVAIMKPKELAHITIPVYLGIGLRLKAAIKVLDANVNLSSLYGLGIAAQEQKVAGNLQVQTLGISGSSISPLIPMPSELNASTIQQAIQALATIKSKIYDNALVGGPLANGASNGLSVTITPSIVGVDNYIGTPGSTESIISLLLQRPQEFNIGEYMRSFD